MAINDQAKRQSLPKESETIPIPLLINHPEKFRIILNAAREWAVDQINLMRERGGIETEVEIEISDSVESEYDAVILSGITPTIIIREGFVFKEFYEGKSWNFRERLRKAFDCIKLVRRTITKPVPFAQVMAYRTEVQGFIKGDNPEKFLRWIDPRFFEIEIQHTVTIRDRITGISRTVSGSDLNELKFKATRDLQRMIASDQIANENHEIEMRKLNSNPIKPEKIALAFRGNEVERVMIYEDVISISNDDKSEIKENSSDA